MTETEQLDQQGILAVMDAAEDILKYCAKHHGKTGQLAILLIAGTMVMAGAGLAPIMDGIMESEFEEDTWN